MMKVCNYFIFCENRYEKKVRFCRNTKTAEQKYLNDSSDLLLIHFSFLLAMNVTFLE